jgi:hypothetical protein
VSLLDKRLGLQSLLSTDEELTYQGGPFDPRNPRSLINIAPAEVVECLREKMPIVYLYMNEQQLEAKFHPGPDLQKIRIAFWKEYEAAQTELRRMSIANIGRFLGQGSFGLAKTLKDPENLAVCLCPVTSYENFLEEGLMAGSKKLRQIIEMPLFNADGSPDHKTMEIVLKAVAFLDMRKHGGIVQKQLQVNMTKNSQSGLIQNASIEEIDAKIKQLEDKQELEIARREVGAQLPELIQIETTDKVINELEARYAGKTTSRRTRES